MKIIEKLKQDSLRIQKEEKSAIDMLELLMEELKQLMSENMDV